MQSLTEVLKQLMFEGQIEKPLNLDEADSLVDALPLIFDDKDKSDTSSSPLESETDNTTKSTCLPIEISKIILSFFDNHNDVFSARLIDHNFLQASNEYMISNQFLDNEMIIAAVRNSLAKSRIKEMMVFNNHLNSFSKANRAFNKLFAIGYLTGICILMIGLINTLLRERPSNERSVLSPTCIGLLGAGFIFLAAAFLMRSSRKELFRNKNEEVEKKDLSFIHAYGNFFTQRLVKENPDYLRNKVMVSRLLK